MKKMFKTNGNKKATAIAKKTAEIAADTVMVTTVTAANCVGGGVVALTIADTVGAIDCANLADSDPIAVGKAVTAGCGLGVISTLCMLKRLGFFKPKNDKHADSDIETEDVEEFYEEASFADAILD